jgi:hypothetical protein
MMKKKIGASRKKTRVHTLNFSQIEKNLLFSLMYGHAPKLEVTLINPRTTQSYHVHELNDHVVPSGSPLERSTFKIMAIENEHVVILEDPTGKGSDVFSKYINYPFILKIETSRHPEHSGEHYVKLLEVRQPLKSLVQGGLGIELLVRRLKDNFEVMKTYNEVNRLLLQ